MAGRRAGYSLIIVLANIFFGSAQYSTGNRDFNVEQVLPCKDGGGTEEIVFFGTRMVKVAAGTFDYFTNYTLKKTLDEKVSVNADVFNWKNGDWQPAGLSVEAPQLCSALKGLSPAWYAALLKNTGTEDCPVPPGTYQVDAPNLSFAQFAKGTLPPGRYRVDFRFKEKDTLVGCVATIFIFPSVRKNAKKSPRPTSPKVSN